MEYNELKARLEQIDNQLESLQQERKQLAMTEGIAAIIAKMKAKGVVGVNFVKAAIDGYIPEKSIIFSNKLPDYDGCIYQVKEYVVLNIIFIDGKLQISYRYIQYEENLQKRRSYETFERIVNTNNGEILEYLNDEIYDLIFGRLLNILMNDDTLYERFGIKGYEDEEIVRLVTLLEEFKISPTADMAIEIGYLINKNIKRRINSLSNDPTKPCNCISGTPWLAWGRLNGTDITDVNDRWDAKVYNKLNNDPSVDHLTSSYDRLKINLRNDGLDSLGVRFVDTSNVTSFRCLFQRCRYLKELDLSHFDTRKVKDVGYMFAECDRLETVDLSNFDLNRAKEYTEMFIDCPSLKTVYLRNCDKTTYKRVNGALRYAGMSNVKIITK